jgi:fatty-acyl-CoA synthase
MSSLEDSIEIRCETVGRAVKAVQIKIVNEKGEPVGPGEIGELLCKGPMIMKRYYQMPAETKQVFDANGWLYTGDLVTIDSFGYIRIVGRKKEMIIRGGENIYPAEVEKVYNAHPDVLEACILGFPHEVLGEQTYAFIKLEDTSVETEESLREYAKGKIAKYKIPDKVIILYEMPHLAGGKVDKDALRNIALMI